MQTTRQQLGRALNDFKAKTLEEITINAVELILTSHMGFRLTGVAQGKNTRTTIYSYHNGLDTIKVFWDRYGPIDIKIYLNGKLVDLIECKNENDNFRMSYGWFNQNIVRASNGNRWSVGHQPKPHLLISKLVPYSEKDRVLIQKGLETLKLQVLQVGGQVLQRSTAILNRIVKLLYQNLQIVNHKPPPSPVHTQTDTEQQNDHQNTYQNTLTINYPILIENKNRITKNRGLPSLEEHVGSWHLWCWVADYSMPTGYTSCTDHIHRFWIMGTRPVSSMASSNYPMQETCHLACYHGKPQAK